MPQTLLEVAAEFSNQDAFLEDLARARKLGLDLTRPLTQIADDFFKSEASVFTRSPGPYEDLKPATKKKKVKDWGSAYPLLVAKGDLRASMTSPKGPGTINEIVNGTLLVVGTRVKSKSGFPYPAVHQAGGKRVAQRSFVFVGPESRFSDSVLNGRVDRWIGILSQYFQKSLGQSGEPVKAA